MDILPSSTTRINPRIGIPNLKNRREEKPIEYVISEVEALGFLPEKQYAFGYVTGVIFGDGSISREKTSQSHIRSDGTKTPGRGFMYFVRLSVTSQVFAERFGSQWEVLTDRPAKIWTKVRTNFDKSTLKGRVEGYSVQLFNFRRCHVLLGRYFSHLKYENDPSYLLKFPLEVMRGFIHGMIDSEGYLNPKVPRRIDIANKDIELLNTLVIMLEQFGYNANVYTSPSQSVSHLVTYMPYSKYTEIL
jgi:hypothetical protein